MIPFLVCEFGKSTLSNVVKECFESDFPDIYHKRQIGYLFRYLDDLSARTIVLESDYVDRDYLDDFSRFYVRRFNGNGHKCARIHFFSHEFDHSDLDSLLVSKTQGKLEVLRDSYLGFMVVKPLPKTFIGKTCLKRYPEKDDENPRRVLSRKYDVNLFGIELSVDSVAFQEQDKVVSACATTAIWSCLHALNSRKIRDIPSCSQITTNAINFIQGTSNGFPNKELTNKQILRAIDVEELRHHSESLRDPLANDLLSTTRYYIDSGVPMILTGTVYSLQKDKVEKKLAGHAVTVLGYKSAESGRKCIYVHDDRLGPFARAELKSITDFEWASGLLPQRHVGVHCLVLQEKDDAGGWAAPHEILLPEIIVGVTDKKVRIPLTDVINTCEAIVDMHVAVATMAASQEDTQSSLAYKIRLSEISDIKSAVWRSTAYIPIDYEPSVQPTIDFGMSPQEKLSFLIKSFARFQWVAEFSLNGKIAFEMLIDATDIPQGNAVSALILHFRSEAHAIFKSVEFYSQALQRQNSGMSALRTFAPSFVRHLQQKEFGLNEHLNVNYGGLRAPVRLKEQELAGGNIQKNATASTFYESTDQAIESHFPKLFSGEIGYMIWVITQDGALMIGEEIDKRGHPCLTGFKPARLGGELKYANGNWMINPYSGRYSSTYGEQKPEFLNNALSRFKAIFWRSRDQLIIEPAGA